MVIGERLKDLREQKKMLPSVESERRGSRSSRTFPMSL